MKRLLALLALLFVVGCATSAPTPDAVAIEIRVAETVKTMKTDIAQAVECTLTAEMTAPRGLVQELATPDVTAAAQRTAYVEQPPTVALKRITRWSPSPLTKREWARRCLPHIETIGDASQKMVYILEEERFGDAAWEARFAIQVARVRKADAALRRIIPPRECQEAHSLLLSGSGDFLLSAKYGLKGLQQLDSALIAKAGPYIRSATSKFQRLNLMLKDLLR